jgi:O-antigen ligase
MFHWESGPNRDESKDAHMTSLADLLARGFLSRRRWVASAVILATCVAAALAVGFLLAELGVLIAGAALVAFALGIWMLTNIEIAYWVVLGVVCLLPFASFPFEIGFRPTFLDAVLGALFAVWVAGVASGRNQHLEATTLGLPVAGFILMSVGSFVFGLANSPLTSYLLRHFAELMLSVMAFFLVINTVRSEQRLRRIAAALITCAVGAAVLGIALYATARWISDDLVITLLSALSRVGYPAGPGVLRYIREDPELSMRATSTSVDPNVLGSLLNIAIAATVPQLFSDRPLFRRRWIVVILGTMLLCLALTMSRGSLVGVGVALSVTATLRYRRLWPLLVLGAILALALPQSQALVGHFLEGLRFEDLATQMRLGEYKDALILIGRHPWLGVGFGGSPDIDTYVGVANVYLLIAEEMGLLGLTAFAVVITVFFVRFYRTRRLARACPDLEPLFWGLHSSVIGALAGGVFDHYFFNLDFHHSVTLFWLMVGLASAAVELIRNNTTDVPPTL